MNWPIGMGSDFKGIYHRSDKYVEQYLGRQEEPDYLWAPNLKDPQVQLMLGEIHADKLVNDIQLLDVAGEQFQQELAERGELTPVFFGSAIYHFGVRSFLDTFVGMAPKPSPKRITNGTAVETCAEFSGFIFKIQANMNPAHRDRVAFLRVCSGRFERGMTVHHIRLNSTINLTQSQQFFAQDRQTVNEAFPGDIIGLYDPGLFQIGDTLSATGGFEFEPLPQFPPEHFARVTIADTLCWFG